METRDQDRKRAATAPVLSTNQTRQGVTGHNVRNVLAISLAAVIVLLAIVYIA